MKFGMDKDDIGIIQGKNKIQIHGKKLVVGMMQSISVSPYDNEIFSSFGVVVVDEVHRICCNTMSRCMERLPAKFRLGLSATLKRGDGLDVIMRWHIGPVVHSISTEEKIEVEKELKPIIHVKRFKGSMGISEALNYSMAIIKMSKNTWLNSKISDVVADEAKKGRVIVVLSHYKLQLETLYNMCLMCGVDENEMSMFTGEVKMKDRAHVLSHRIIFATYGVMEEGVDKPELDTVIKATPKSSIEQAFGRATRYFPNKPRPQLFDFVNDCKQFKNMERNRRKYYEKNQFEIIESNLI